MPTLDLMDRLPDFPADEPAGENLEFDPSFAELERLAQGKPEQQYGSTIVPAEEPEWKEVVASATALMARSLDLRVLAQLGVARLHRDGVVAFAATLGLVREALETRWSQVHPQLDPEDDNDPTLRANALLALAEPVRVLRVLRNAPLARSPRAGTVSWRDISVASGALEPVEDTPRMTDAVIAAAFRETDQAGLAGLRDAVASALASTVAIPAAFDANAGHGTGPDFTPLTRLLRELGQMMDRHTPAGMPQEPESASLAPTSLDAGALPAATADGAGPAVVQRAAPVMSIATMGPPTNRADALRLLDLAAEYYEQHEPSSPLPLLIARARRLAEMGFMDILRDMAPDGVSQAERIAGISSSGF